MGCSLEVLEATPKGIHRVAPKEDEVVWGSLHPVLHPQVGNLKAHLKIHIADGPLKCRECGKQFTTSGNTGEGTEELSNGTWMVWGEQGVFQGWIRARGRISSRLYGAMVVLHKFLGLPMEPHPGKEIFIQMLEMWMPPPIFSQPAAEPEGWNDPGGVF